MGFPPAATGGLRVLGPFPIAFDDPLLLPVNEEMAISITGAPTGGTFRLSYAGNDDGDPIDWNTNAADFQAALESNSPFTPGQVLVTGANPHFVVTIYADGGTQLDTLLVLSDNSLTGGTAPNVTITETVVGNYGGVTVTSMASGDLLFNVILEVDEVWDGTTPHGFVHTYPVGITDGEVLCSSFDLTVPALVNPVTIHPESAIDVDGYGFLLRFPTAQVIRFRVATATNNQDPGATQGTALLYLVVATPSP